MMKKNLFLFLKELKKIVQAARVKRASYSLLSIFAAASFVNIINLDILVMAFIAILMYSIGGLHNAKQDRDFKEDNHLFLFASVILLSLSLILSLINLKIFFIISLILVLTVSYNTFSRKILYADMFILSLTHIFIPFMGALWVLGKNPFAYILYILPVTFAFIFLANTKNMIGFKEDKKRGYITLMTLFKKGKIAMMFSLFIGLIILINYFLIFKIKLNFFLVFFIFFIFIFLMRDINLIEGEKATSLVRIIIFLFLLIYLINNKANILIMGLFFLSGAVFIKEGLILLKDDIKSWVFHK